MKEETPIDFLYLSFGNEDSYKQAIFSILSLLAKNQDYKYRINVATDNNQIFKNFLFHWDIRYIDLTKSDLEFMKGEINFIHRIKIAAIEKLFAKGCNKICYIDSDTFFVESLKDKISAISDNGFLMHKHEFHFLNAKHEDEASPTRHLNDFIERGQIKILHYGESYIMHLNFSSWNAGVIGLDRSDLQLLNKVYSFTDSIYKATQHHASEQFSFSYVFETSGSVNTCEKEIFHYWPGLQKQIAAEYFSKFLAEGFANLKEQEKLSLVDKSIHNLRQLFNTHRSVWEQNAITAFLSSNYLYGYNWFLKLVLRGQISGRFLKNVLYYTKIKLFKSLGFY